MPPAIVGFTHDEFFVTDGSRHRSLGSVDAWTTRTPAWKKKFFALA